MCGWQWDTRGDFLGDPGLELIGYQACFTELTAGYFLFNHTCKGTLAVLVEVMVDLYAGPVFESCKTGTSECPQHCLNKGDLGPCTVQCKCAHVRELLQIVRRWPKHTNSWAHHST